MRHCYHKGPKINNAFYIKITSRAFQRKKELNKHRKYFLLKVFFWTLCFLEIYFNIFFYSNLLQVKNTSSWHLVLHDFFFLANLILQHKVFWPDTIHDHSFSTHLFWNWYILKFGDTKNNWNRSCPPCHENRSDKVANKQKHYRFLRAKAW